jgi:hypothetical protein
MTDFALLGYSGDACVFRYPPSPDTLSEADARKALALAREQLHRAGCMTVECSGGFEAYCGDMRRTLVMVKVGAGEFQETA